MPPAAAMIGSALLGAGAQMYTSQVGRRQQANLAYRQEQLARQERIRQSQIAKQKESQMAVATNLDRGMIRTAENAQSLTKSITPLGEAMSNAVLDSRYT